MRLVYQDYNFTANISQGEMTVIIAENQKTFCDFVSNIKEMLDSRVEKGFSAKLQKDFKFNIQRDKSNSKRRIMDAGAGA